MNSFFDSNYQGLVFDLAQGEWLADKTGKVLSTLLGSCVAVCLWDPVMLAGGMNHFLLPTPALGEHPSAELQGRYGNLAVERLISDLVKLGAQKERLQAKIFGGAQMFAFGGHEHLLPVGEQNVQFIQQHLAQLKIPIAAADVGQDHARKIYFDTKTGNVKLFRQKEGA